MAENYYNKRDEDSTQRILNLLDDLPDFCTDFFIGIESRTSVLTRLNYAYDLRIFFDYLIKRVPLFANRSMRDFSCLDIEKITINDLERYASYLNMYFLSAPDKTNKVKHTNSQSGKARKLSTIRVLYKYLFNKDLIKVNTAAKLQMPKIHDKDIIRLETDEVVKLLDHAENGQGLTKQQQAFHKATRLRDVAILTLFLGTGIRISECVGLNIQDFDFNSNAFNVRRKGGSQVTLYFSDEIASALIAYLKERENDQTLDNEAMFLSLQKKRISVRAVQDLVKKYSKTVTTLKKITPHKLRSTYGTALYRETQDIYVVADVLGHKDVNTTKKHYAALSEDIRKAAANKVVLRDKKKE